ncbi:S41 family peptidase [Nonomuraea sp. 3N208]|uniref:S41 family peptidase n=1 Tax=Nonomuraea sp. 3N208 TaxID=3457421 RepID=UPI003FD46A70
MSTPPVLGLAADHALGAVREMPAVRESLRQNPLTPAQREVIVREALTVVDGLYAHLLQKRAMYAIDPVQRLRLLRAKIPQLTDEEFHTELFRIFAQLRDGHTEYILPAPYQGPVAFLGILLERCFEGGRPRWIVSKRWIRLTGDPELVPGVEVTHWNGSPIELAVVRHAERESGGNQAARHARGLQSMTLRSFVSGALLDEDWVDLSYRTSSGTVREVRIPWRVFDSIQELREFLNPPAEGPLSVVGFDLRTTLAQRVRKQLFASAAEDDFDLRRDELQARILQTPQGPIGYLRIFSFHMTDRLGNGAVDDIIEFISDVVDVLPQMPKNGLIIDVRDNGGGFVFAAEFLLQLLTPRPIGPGVTQFISTQTTSRLVEALDELSPWRESIRESLHTGAQYSAALPLIPAELVNSVGQLYHGLVVLITDALCYSATDIFAAGFQDHAIGTVLGVDEATGAGGAEVRTHTQIKKEWPLGPLTELPELADFRVSFRRSVRVGTHFGQILEDFGVRPDELHRLTRRDLLEGNPDLLAKAAEILHRTPSRTMDVGDITITGADVTLTLTTERLTGLDVYANGRPITTAVVLDGINVVSFTLPATEVVVVRLAGFQQDALAAARNLRFTSTQPDEKPVFVFDPDPLGGLPLS